LPIYRTKTGSRNAAVTYAISFLYLILYLLMSLICCVLFVLQIYSCMEGWAHRPYIAVYQVGSSKQ